MGWFHAALADGENPFEGMEGEACPLPKKKAPPPPCPKDLTGVEVIYHMCPKAEWELAVKEKVPYFPATFAKDGRFTHASTRKEGLIETANEFYNTPGSDKAAEWICLELNLKAILQMGIVIIPQELNTEEEKKQEEDVQCLKVYSGITTTIPNVLMKKYSMDRYSCGTFSSLTEIRPPNPPPPVASRHPQDVSEEHIKKSKSSKSRSKEKKSKEEKKSKKSGISSLWKKSEKVG